MSVLAYFLLAAVIIVSVCLLLSRRGGRRDFDWEGIGTGQETSLPGGWDSLASELSARIFDPEDLNFVASEASRQLTRQFRRERTMLALDWLRAVRGQVNHLIRAHLRAARGNAELKPAEEIKLGFEFLVFQLTSGILYLVIWAFGPPRAAKLVGYSLELAGQMRKVTEDILPAGRPVVADLMDSKQEPKS
ncbi:MAG: hypothetical protein DMG48_18190 [Acidobacteria bacterium]|nr:MAG: hypothetical protein DMG48_18190 [Acidobacteriota bacterium]